MFQRPVLSVRRCVFVVLVGVAVLGAPALKAADAVQDLGARLEAIVAQRGVPGIAAVVVRGDRIVAQGVAGVRKAGSPEPLTLDDRFLLCSAGKAMTATLAAQLVEEGKLSWQSTLGEILGEPEAKMHPAWKSATLVQLLQHRAGAPGDGSRIWTLLRAHFSRGSAEEKRRFVVSRTLAAPPVYTPGTRYGYASIDYLMVGEMLRKVTGRPWEELMCERLWMPQGMTSAGYGAPGRPEAIDQPWGHWGMVMNGRPVKPGGFWARLNVPLFFGPAGAAHMTMGDWAKFVALHLRGDPANPNHGPTLLRGDTFAALHRPAPDTFYEAGWILLTRPWAKGNRPGDVGRAITSQGDNGFWHCEAWVAPEIDLAILIACNQGGAAANKPAALASDDVLDALVREFASAR